MMAEYIEREAALMYAKLLVHVAYSRTRALDDKEIEKAINSIPAADVREMEQEGRVITNADKIRAMSDEELAKWINKHDCHTNLYGYDHKDAVIDWLKQEAET